MKTNRRIKFILYIISTLIYIWSIYYISATILLNIYFPKSIQIADTRLNISSMWSVWPGRLNLRNVEVIIDGENYMRMKFDYISINYCPWSFLKEDLIITEIKADRVILSYTRGILRRINIKDSLPMTHTAPMPKDLNEVFIFPDNKRIKIKTFTVASVNYIDFNNIRIQEGISVNCSILISKDVYINDFALNFDDSIFMLKSSGTTLGNNISGKATLVDNSPIILKDFLFLGNYYRRLKLNGNLHPPFFMQRKETRNDFFTLKGGESEIIWDIYVKNNKIININQYQIYSERFRILCSEMDITGNTVIKLTNIDNTTHLNIKAKDLFIIEMEKEIHYPDGILEIDVIDVFPVINGIAFLTSSSDINISIKKARQY